jgi:hypothetical protein
MTANGHGDLDANVATWYDQDAGPLVRPYAMTGGRTHHGDYDLNIISLVFTVAAPSDIAVESERYLILQLCRSPKSVAEVAAALDLPLAVVKVLLSDLIDRGQVVCRSPVLTERLQNASFLQVVLDGIEQL